MEKILSKMTKGTPRPVERIDRITSLLGETFAYGKSDTDLYAFLAELCHGDPSADIFHIRDAAMEFALKNTEIAEVSISEGKSDEKMELIETIRKEWHEHPDLRLGQLCFNKFR